MIRRRVRRATAALVAIAMPLSIATLGAIAAGAAPLSAAAAPVAGRPALGPTAAPDRSPPGPTAGPATGHADRVEYHDPGSPPSRGPSNAPVAIEIFFVPGGGMPVAALRALAQLQANHPSRVRLVYRVLKSGASLLVPSAALEAHAEGKFFELLSALMPLRTSLKRDEIVELAGRAGVDRDRVEHASEVEHYRGVLDDNQHRFERLHATTVPAILFNARALKLPLGNVTAVDLEREYLAAYARALDKLDRGYALAGLAQAFDDDAMTAIPPVVMTVGSTDDDDTRSPTEHPLASPPLQLDGLPSFGAPGATPRVPIVVLCRPSDATCSNLLRVVEPEVRLYPDDVRLVWAPWFDIGRDDAAELTLLGDAALCAETIGSNQGELTTSPGWTWVREMYTQVSRQRGKKLDASRLIDAIATRLDIDPRALAACRARMATTTLDWVAAARRAGVPRASFAVVIGGRIYDGLTEQAVIQALVEAELAPGVLGSLPRWHTTK